MTALFDLTFGASIFFALALAVFFFVTRTPRAALQRIREVTYSDRHSRRSVPMGSNAGRRFMAMVQWMRARLGLTVGKCSDQGFAEKPTIKIWMEDDRDCVAEFGGIDGARKTRPIRL